MEKSKIFVNRENRRIDAGKLLAQKQAKERRNPLLVKFVKILLDINALEE